MDSIDLNILRALQKDCDVSAAEMAERVGLSHTPYWRRMKKLEQGGIIKARVVLLDQQKLGLTVNVLANVRLRQHDEETLEALESAVKDQPEIVECFSMSGDSDYLFRVVVRNIEEYELFLKKVLLHLPGVASVNSRFALKCIKMTTELPLR